jgi:hypothetical protein
MLISQKDLSTERKSIALNGRISNTFNFKTRLWNTDDVLPRVVGCGT